MRSLYWIEKSTGALVACGRHIGPDRLLTVSGPPNPVFYLDDALKLCRDGERPVKVRLIREG